MTRRLIGLFTLVRHTVTAFNEDKAQRLASSIAYATIFSIVPLFIIIIALGGAIAGFGPGHAPTDIENTLLKAIRDQAGSAAAETIRALIDSTYAKPRQTLFAQILGWATFFLGASGLFGALQDALNAVWHVDDKQFGFWQLVRDRVATFGMILVVGFLLLITFLASVAVSSVALYFSEHVPAGGPFIITVLDLALTIAVATGLFAALYRILPNVVLKWTDVRLGAFITAVLFVLGQQAIALYLSLAGISSTYGAAGSILVALLWIYYSAMIFLFGAEFTKVHAQRHDFDRRPPDAPAGG